MSKSHEKTPPKQASEIQAFVHETLSSIFDAVDQANEKNMSNSSVQIRIGGSPLGKSRPIGNQFTFEMPSEVAFDIAVTASEDSKINGGLDLKIAKIGSDVAAGNSKVSRVNFAIPITKNS